jgi:regulator of protease activity HflC (stomatin/prohibitin superfamily)
MFNDKETSLTKIIGLVIGGTVFVGVLFFGSSALYKVYNVWAMEQEGKAILMKAEQTRQIQIAQAMAEKDSAVLRAEAIAIIGKAAKEYPEYRQQEYIGAFAEALKEGKMQQIIYVPTEANIPILEAGKR